MPLKADLFEAHLSAYSETKPIVEALRLCHRFGQRAQRCIADLPSELIHLIEEEVFEEAIDRCVLGWGVNTQCFEKTCLSVDHFSQKGLKRIWIWKMGKFCEPDLEDQEFINYLSDRYSRRHVKQQNSWLNRVYPLLRSCKDTMVSRNAFEYLLDLAKTAESREPPSVWKR